MLIAQQVEKLINVLVKLYSKIGNIVQDGQGVFMPMDPNTNESKGFAYVEFEDVQCAAQVAFPLQTDSIVTHSQGDDWHLHRF